MDKKKLDVYQTFLSIYEEVIGKVNGIKELEAEVQKIKNLIPGKEYSVDTLHREVKELKEQNKEYHEMILQNNLERKQYDTQASQLHVLINCINDKIQEYQQLDDELELPTEINREVDKKIDQVIQLVSTEFTQIRDDKIEKERKQLHKESKAIEKEVRKLNGFQKDWDPIEHFNNIAIEECEMRYSPEDYTEFHSLSLIPVPVTDKSPNLMESCCTVLPDSSNNLELLQQKVDKFLQLQSEQDKFLNSSYESQSEYLKSLRNELSEKSLTEQDLQKIEIQFQNRVQEMDELTEINPIQIPEIQISNHAEQSIQILTNQFDKFCQEIENDHPYNSLSESFINSTQNSLHILPFEEPKKLPCIKKPVPSPELIQLADSLKNLIKSVNKVESLRQIQEKVASQRKLFEENSQNEEKLYRNEQNDSDSDILHIPLPRPLSPPPENLTTIEFKELEKSKLPDMFFSVADLPDFNLQIEDLPEESQIKTESQSDISNASESFNSFQNQNDISNASESFNSFQNQSAETDSRISMNAEQRSRAFQNILKDFASFEISPIPRFIPPVPVELRVKPIDMQPMKDQLDNMLESVQEDTSALIDDINYLENEVQKCVIQLKKEFGDDHDEITNLVFSIDEFENEIMNDIKNLELRKSSIEKEKERTVNKAKEIKNQLKNSSNEIHNLKKKLEQVTITPEMIKEKKEEAYAKQNELERKYELKLKSMKSSP